MTGSKRGRAKEWGVDASKDTDRIVELAKREEGECVFDPANRTCVNARTEHFELQYRAGASLGARCGDGAGRHALGCCSRRPTECVQPFATRRVGTDGCFFADGRAEVKIRKVYEKNIGGVRGWGRACFRGLLKSGVHDPDARGHHRALFRVSRLLKCEETDNVVTGRCRTEQEYGS